MPRTLTLERELLRTFKRLDKWSDFLDLWPQVDTEEEANSLLFVGTKILLSTTLLDAKAFLEVSERADFYLTISNHSNRTLATTAQQLIVKYLLPQAQTENSWAELHLKFLKFLEEPLTSLYEPPYPRFVHQYLSDRLLKATLGAKPRLTALTPVSPELLGPLVAWGLVSELSYYQLTDSQRKLLVEYFSKYLKERELSPLGAFQNFYPNAGWDRINNEVLRHGVDQRVAEALVSITGHQDFHAAAQGREPTALLKALA
ncbi:MAG TPA: hypothetical protein VLE93_02240 [Candidatus Saccharimonadales bacterium]|nr:hypothetical protein [Candidatus Saccharimonadales bacterium]